MASKYYKKRLINYSYIYNCARCFNTRVHAGSAIEKHLVPFSLKFQENFLDFQQRLKIFRPLIFFTFPFSLHLRRFFLWGGVGWLTSSHRWLCCHRHPFISLLGQNALLGLSLTQNKGTLMVMKFAHTIGNAWEMWKCQPMNCML